MSEQALEPTMDTFWAEAKQSRLKFQKCDHCGYVRWPPAGVCPECLKRSSTWVDVEGRGKIWSFVVYNRPYSKKLAQYVPYNVALVELTCGVRYLAPIVDCDPDDIRIGQEVEVDFRPVFDGPVVPVFRPVDQ